MSDIFMKHIKNTICYLTVADRAEWVSGMLWLDDLWGVVPKHEKEGRIRTKKTTTNISQLHLFM